MKSKVTEAKLEVRKKTGEYEGEVYTLTAIVDEKESGVQVLTELKKQINEAFTGESSEDAEEQTTTSSKTGKKGKKNAKGKPSNTDDEDTDDEDSGEEADGDEDESSSDDETTDDEDGDSGDDSSEDSEDSEDDAEEESSSKSGKSSKGSSSKAGKSSDKKDAGKKKSTKKPQDYNREIEQHKKIFSSLLGLVAPNWKNSDSGKAKAKLTSVKMNGSEFLDANGEVLPEFKAEVKKLMNAAGKKK